MASGQVARECSGTRKGKTCGGYLFVCANPECRSEGCEKSGCDNRQFTPIQKCKDCGRSYERIQQFDVAPAPAEEPGAASTAPGVRIAMPNIELVFGGLLALAALIAAIVALGGNFGGLQSPGTSAPIKAPDINAGAAPAGQAYSDICQCYRGGMDLAGTSATVLSSQYRTGFMQCRAAFGAQGGDAWTAGWTARAEGKVVGAGCRSWLKGVGR
ncbi:MAG TPA: hypothetical protein PKM48_01185 [Parvularculaceae bacterium]|nr:hypothetical protein [Parvularculaceae bacterium]HNS86851.1 hypothetical protein [Parvularculaceae bacterium]